MNHICRKPSYFLSIAANSGNYPLSIGGNVINVNQKGGVQEIDTRSRTRRTSVLGQCRNDDYVPIVLSSDEKVKFLRKCCASPLLRFILHLLSNSRNENLCSWYGGPFGVRIWDTRKFTESYNIAMRTQMNFTNVSRALQACEQITIAGNRLWKRIKQGEYSFFPSYKGHGIPFIPHSAMPRDVPPHFPFERCGIVKMPSSQPVPDYSISHSAMKDSASVSTQYHKESFYRSPPIPPPHMLSNRCALLKNATTSPSAQFLLSPTPSLPFTPRNLGSHAYSSIMSPCLTQILSAVPTPPPSDTSSTSTDPLCFDESLLSQSHSPEVFTPLFGTCAQELSTIPSENTDEDIFGNTASASGFDLSIDETSLLYH
uniref:ETS domain-containing protein n=1 Tax=Angiostrongylus cantonensis TaxID=6313 RepID=A0A0K0DD29_ANGCA